MNGYKTLLSMAFGMFLLGAGGGLALAETGEAEALAKIDSEASVTVGYRGVGSNNNPGRAREYDSLESGPLFNVKLFADQGPYHLDLDIGFLNEDDYRGELHFDTKDLLRLDLRTDRFYHNLDHIPYESRPPASSNGIPRVDFNDQDPGDRYGLRLDTNEMKFKIKCPDYPAHVNLSYWRYEKSGRQQLRYADENCAAACHMQSKTSKLDRVTEEIKASTDAHVGFVDVVLETLLRTFRDREPVPNDYFDAHGRGRDAGYFDHDEDPDSTLRETTLKLNTAPSGGLVGSASFTIGKRENHSDLVSVAPVKAETDYYKTSADVTYTPGEKWTVNFRYRLLDMDADNSALLNAYGVDDNPNDLDVREAMDIKRSWYEASVNYRPSRQLTLKGELRREDIDRSNTGLAQTHVSSETNPIQINPRWQLPDEETIIRAKLGFSSRLLEKSKLKLSGWGAVQRNDDPAYGASFEASQELFLSTSYNPSPLWGVMGSASLLRQENEGHELHGYERDRTREQQNLSLGSWANPREGLGFDLNYGYFRTAIEQDLLFGTASAYAIQDAAVDYRQAVHTLTLGMTWQALENLSCRLETYHIRSKADFSPDFYAGPFDYNPYGIPYLGDASSDDLKHISKVDVRQKGLRGRLNWQIDEDWACVVEASYDKYDERNSSVFDGSVQTCMVSLSRSW